MSIPSSCRIHPSAVISGDVRLGENVEVGALAVIEGSVTIGESCIIRPGAFLFGPLTMGKGNAIYSGAVLGERPQHLKYNNEPTTLEIGDRNIIRENVTVHRGTTHSMKTVIGDDNFLMANSHVAHDCVVGHRCVLANGAVHQFCRLGRLSLLGGCSATQKDIPPFVMQLGLDNVVGLNLVGMKRAGMSREQINAARAAFRMLFREGLVLPAAMAKMEREFGALDVIQEMLTFLRGCTRGVNVMRGRMQDDLAA
jgi:UDP-N-acetylglucosamine acyltransferase